MFNKQRNALNDGWYWTLWRFQIMYFEAKRIHFSFTRGFMPSIGFYVALAYMTWQPKVWRFPYLRIRSS